MPSRPTYRPAPRPTRTPHPTPAPATPARRAARPRVGSAILSSLLLVALFVLFGIMLGITYTEVVGNSNHGSNFQEFVVNTRGVPFEVWASFKTDGTKVAEYCSMDTQSVSVPGLSYIYSDIMGAKIRLHTHPSDAPFSLSDVKNAGTHSSAAIVVISPNYTYYLSPGKDGWPSTEAVEELESFAASTDMQTFFSVVDQDENGTLVTSTDALMELLATSFDLYYYRFDGHVWPSETISQCLG